MVVSKHETFWDAVRKLTGDYGQAEIEAGDHYPIPSVVLSSVGAFDMLFVATSTVEIMGFIIAHDAGGYTVFNTFPVEAVDSFEPIKRKS